MTKKQKLNVFLSSVCGFALGICISLGAFSDAVTLGVGVVILTALYDWD
jgi:hypothetical protein